MANVFDSIAVKKLNRNMFNMTHDVKMSCNMGQLVPVLLTECVPGDKVRIGCNSMIRFAPLVAPMMHRCDATVHYFFVPYRLLWQGWEGYITGQLGPGDLPYTHPFVTYTGSATGYGTDEPGDGSWGKLDDYLGIPPMPTGAINPQNVSALGFAAYQRCWADWYRDQNLQVVNNDVTFSTPFLNDGDNTDVTDLKKLRYRAWEHDYFTSCLPFAQKGEPVDLPLGEVELRSDFITNATDNNENPHFKGFAGDVVSGEVFANDRATETPGVGAAGPSIGGGDTGDVFPPYFYDPAGSLTVGATTINDLRRAEALQKLLELNARGGTRYIEFIRAHFNVKSSDKRLQRAEYITGIKQPVVISEVLNTTGTEDLPQGNMAGHGVSVISGNYGSYFAEEHGFVIGIMSVMPKTAYVEAVDRQWMKYRSPYDYYFPSLANIGEQEVYTGEVNFFVGNNQFDTFGYIPRYSEYRFAHNRVAGQFRTTLDYWHMARKFGASVPVLNDEFIVSDPTKRVFAVTDPAVDSLFIHHLNSMYISRLMPKYGTPML